MRNLSQNSDPNLRDRDRRTSNRFQIAQVTSASSIKRRLPNSLARQPLTLSAPAKPPTLRVWRSLSRPAVAASVRSGKGGLINAPVPLDRVNSCGRPLESSQWLSLFDLVSGLHPLLCPSPPVTSALPSSNQKGTLIELAQPDPSSYSQRFL